MELMGKLASNDTKNIGMLPSASKYVSINFADQCLHILNNNEILNWLKGSSKCKKDNHNSNIKHVYTMFSNSDVDHRGRKMIRNNKLFLSLNVINGKTLPYESKGVLIHYHYWFDPKGRRLRLSGLVAQQTRPGRRRRRSRSRRKTYWSLTSGRMGWTVFTTCMLLTLTPSPIWPRPRKNAYKRQKGGRSGWTWQHASSSAGTSSPLSPR